MRRMVEGLVWRVSVTRPAFHVRPGSRPSPGHRVASLASAYPSTPIAISSSRKMVSARVAKISKANVRHAALNQPRA
jgi:hypothetical protein